eukprot:3141462-Amphidinium_carterae.1
MGLDVRFNGSCPSDLMRKLEQHGVSTPSQGWMTPTSSRPAMEVRRLQAISAPSELGTRFVGNHFSIIAGAPARNWLKRIDRKARIKMWPHSI